MNTGVPHWHVDAGAAPGVAKAIAMALVIASATSAATFSTRVVAFTEE